MPTTLADAADAFYAAGNQMLAGDLSGIEAIWSEADDISLLSPIGTTCTGRSAVLEEFARESRMGFEGRLEADDHRFVETAEMAYLVCMERTRGMTRDGVAITTDVRATTIFRKEQGHWRAVHHHTDRFSPDP